MAGNITAVHIDYGKDRLSVVQEVDHFLSLYQCVDTTFADFTCGYVLQVQVQGETRGLKVIRIVYFYGNY